MNAITVIFSQKFHEFVRNYTVVLHMALIYESSVPKALVNIANHGTFTYLYIYIL